ncbi:hypothetical protein [Micromonospora musae]|uniref:Uncharacterized protein n=1 Tax=Micromonospora musae TaxID=1894970 RepID=A0A3A9Y0D7_9ACTN|nr:hypothetical protein [Micromonospora musae]RKN27254.1 hypothetical protein D7044_28035 [Micromonospora musae]
MGSEPTESFHDFCLSLHNTPLPGKGTEAFGIPLRTGESFFVPPMLLEKDDQPEPLVTLVSARGAAGKSTTAFELAARIDAPLWRLDLDKAVGATSLEYALGRYLGTHDVRAELDGRQRPIVVIDSLDEARARVSGVSWTEFIGSLGDLAEQGLRYVLFGRERTLEDIWVTLGDLDLPVAWWEISHFAALQCADYVDGVVKRRDPQTDCAAAEYGAARDALIASLRGAAEGAYADAFVGYAPVLDAVAAMLIRRPNFLQIRRRFEDAGPQAEGRIALLRDILDNLLKREQLKIKPLAEELGADATRTYTPREQIRWLCHFLDGAEPPDLSYLPSASTRQEYVKRISTFGAEHPFRAEHNWASPVFEAYVASVEFDGSVFSPERIVEIGHASGLLLDFVGARSDQLISESQFAALHASIMASEWAESMTSISVDEVSEDVYEVTFAIKRGAERPHVTRFDLMPEATGVLQILGPLAELSVRSRGTVAVPGKPQGTVLGPDFFVHAAAVRFEGPALEFARRSEAETRGGDNDASVVIEVYESLQLPPTSTQLPPASDLELRVPAHLKLGHPWYEYRAESEPVDEASPDQKVIRFLNKLMNLTRNHGHSGERGVFIKKFEGRQPFTPTDFTVALTALVDANVVRIENDMVFLKMEWEPYRYNGKALQGQRQLTDVLDAWGPVIQSIEQRVSGR